jgi:hypothetical protein
MTLPKPPTHAEAGGGSEVAAEDLDLAFARLRWAESCRCPRTAEQAAALQLLAAQVTALDQQSPLPPDTPR